MGDPCRPAVPIEVEPDPDHLLVMGDGTVREHFNLFYSEEDTERIRLGYCCINCGESQHPNSMPEECWVCHFPMRARQLERFGKEFLGRIRLGPSTSSSEELEIAAEWLERKELAERGFRKTGSVVIPRGI